MADDLPTKPTAAESAKWHREQAKYHGSTRDQWARDSQHMRLRRDANVQKHATLAARHESAAEALDLLAEIAKARMDRTTAWAVTHNGAPPNGVALNLPSELAARLVALVEGK